ncbi:MAG: response regulator transcription factor [Anaerolineae bacterium]|nr:response regulator transcription factor [Anaerolineae bacterium]MCO5187060.1 response regulator transcription factor [Anaerolineae bacterium]MCO5199491.1 response regulator transcription factor [Anaerolineae bacterium]MCO5207075.1 response regulator transcription factor [Anaerolineae bacterium]
MGRVLRVLIADDRSRSRSGLRAILAMCPDLEVVGEATDGQESVALAATIHPDVVLMDMRMPVMDGETAIREINRLFPRIRVIALSLYREYEERALAAGAEAFLLKGCSAETLFAAMHGGAM